MTAERKRWGVNPSLGKGISFEFGNDKLFPETQDLTFGELEDHGVH